MPSGSSTWNGNYGAIEKKRRETYPREERYGLEKMIEAGEPKKPADAPDWSKVIKDPR